MHRALTPLTKPSKNVPFAVCDIEAADWNVLLTIGHYSGERKFREFPTMNEFYKFVFKRQETVIYAHFGGIYDFLFLLTDLLGSDEFHIRSFLPRGSGLLSLTVSDGRRDIQFRDSSALLPFSLENITKTFKVKHTKSHFDFTKIAGYTRKTIPADILRELLTYLEIDCVGLYEVLKAYEDNPLVSQVGLKITRSAQALQVFRTYLKKPLPALSQSQDEFVRRAYAGGRTEIFRPFYRSNTVPLNVYDVNSLYPSVLRDFDMPTGFKKVSRQVDLEQIGFGEFTVEVPEDNYLPVLWTRETGKFIFPVGTFSGVWPLCEVKKAIEVNGAKIIKSGKIMYFNNGGSYFRDYVESLYDLRVRSSDPVTKVVIKDLLNHIYGRMGLNTEREELVFDDGSEGLIPTREITVQGKTYRLAKKPISLNSFSNVAIAGWTTALARIRLYDTILKPCERTIHYTDTDSGYTTSTLPSSSLLGALKWEGNCWHPAYSRLDTKKEIPAEYAACFLLPKGYIAGSKVAIKGFPNRKIKHFQIEDFENALSGDLRLMRIEMEARGLNKFKTGLMKGDLLSKRGLTRKQIKAKYDKRIVFRDKNGNWDTRPLVLGK